MQWGISSVSLSFVERKQEKTNEVPSKLTMESEAGGTKVLMNLPLLAQAQRLKALDQRLRQRVREHREGRRTEERV